MRDLKTRSKTEPAKDHPNSREDEILHHCIGCGDPLPRNAPDVICGKC